MMRPTKISKPKWRAEIAPIATAFLAVGAITALTVAVGGRRDLTNSVVLFLFTIALVSMNLGYRASLAAAVASAVSFDYFLVFPYHSLAIARGRDLFTMAAMVAVAIFTSTLNERLRRQARAALQSERETESLYSLVTELANTRSFGDLCATAARELEATVGMPVWIWLRDVRRRVDENAGAHDAVSWHESEREIVDWAITNALPAGRGTSQQAGAAGTYLPLIAPRGCIGVVGVRQHDGAASAATVPFALLLSMVGQVAMAMERMLLGEEIAEAHRETETEHVRNAVLTSVSHDLRGPLAIIGSASSTLLEHGDRLDSKARDEMAKIVNEEARRLNDLLKSLLDVTRLESGGLTVKRDWESLEEVVGSVLGRISESHRARRVKTSVPSTLPLVQIDATLIEQVLVNLIENALKYAGDERPIELEVAARTENDVLVSVIDHGRGIGDSELTRVFDKFYRVDKSGSVGLGLGLTIARGIVEAHGGKMWASTTPGGGLTIQFTLPLADFGCKSAHHELIEGIHP